jgi:hypothetical protein
MPKAWPTVNERYLTFTEEINALDYLKRAAGFIREVTSDEEAWKWVIIALHGALYGSAICACKGTNYHSVTTETKRGRRLISLSQALEACQDPERMRMTVMSRPLVLTDDQRAAIGNLQFTLRNPFEHYVPMSWHIEIHGLPTMAVHCIEVIRFLALESGNYTMLSRSQYDLIKCLAAETTEFLRSMPLHAEYLSMGSRSQ